MPTPRATYVFVWHVPLHTLPVVWRWIILNGLDRGRYHLIMNTILRESGTWPETGEILATDVLVTYQLLPPTITRTTVSGPGPSSAITLSDFSWNGSRAIPSSLVSHHHRSCCCCDEDSRPLIFFAFKLRNYIHALRVNPHREINCA